MAVAAADVVAQFEEDALLERVIFQALEVGVAGAALVALGAAQVAGQVVDGLGPAGVGVVDDAAPAEVVVL